MARPVEVLEVPTGTNLLRLLPRLADALAGGPAVLPMPAAAAGSPPEPGYLGPDDDDPDDPTAVVMPTSGSTGEPKQVLLPASALRASAAATQARLGGPGGWLLALPGWHIAGLQVLLRAAGSGNETAVLDTAQPFSPSRFAAAAARLDSDRRYVSLVPTQLHRLLSDPAATAALAGFDAVLVGGAAASSTLLSNARGAGVRVVTTYGMSETCGGCVYGGAPLDGVTVRLRPDTNEPRTGEPGRGEPGTNEPGADRQHNPRRIVLSGPMIARGYRGMPGHPAFPAPGTFVTDDVGSWRPGRHGARLAVLGRADDVIVTGGLKVPPGPVEQALAGLSGVGEVLVVGVPDAEWGQLVVCVLTGREPEAAAVDRALAGLPRHYRPRRWMPVADLPRSGPGKPNRRAATELAIAALAGR